MADNRAVELVLPTRKGEFKVSNTNFADLAERIMSQRAEKFPNLTTTKLRGIYANVASLYSKIGNEKEFAKYIGDIQYLKVKMAYESGRENEVKSFLGSSGLLLLLDKVESYEQFVLYCRYAESLVAYFKFFGGKE